MPLIIDLKNESDRYGSILYTFTFGDGIATDQITHGTVEHAYTTPGHYTAIVRVLLESHVEIASIAQEVYIQGR